MKLLPLALLVLLFSGLSPGLLALQRNGLDSDDGESLPTNTNEKAEWIFARFHYDSGDEFGYFRGFQRWAADYPKSDRQFIEGVQRLTRVETRSTEQVVDANSDDIFNWPWIFVEDAGAWRVSDSQGQRLREYLLKGGFIMLDDTHGDVEWEYLMSGVRTIFPDREVEELTDGDELFHVLYDLDDRFQIPGRGLSGVAANIPLIARFQNGAVFGTKKGGLWWQSATIQTWETLGNGRIVLGILNGRRPWPTK